MRPGCGLLIFGLLLAAADLRADAEIERVLKLNAGPNNPRNSEGDLIQLQDGQVLFVYTHFTGGVGDHARAHLASRVSQNEGRSWSDESQVVVADEGRMNVMSVSLVRLPDKRIALFYVRKNSVRDCRPILRISDDEAKTWGPPVEIIPDAEVDYYVLNNARVAQLTGGRLIVPVAQHHNSVGKPFNGAAKMLCYYSDDAGNTWRRGQAAEYPSEAKANSVCQEPGVIELKDGRVMLYCRTNMGSQCVAHSSDAGETWTQLASSPLISPLSPATIVRIPTSGDLLAVWNDHSSVPAELAGKRTPLSAAISRDEGKTWQPSRTLEDDPRGWYCYTAARFLGEHVLLAYCAGERFGPGKHGLEDTQISRVPIEWFYGRR